MSFTVYITRDYNAMSNKAAELMLPAMAEATREGWFNLGLATGNSPRGLYDLIIQRQHEFDARKVRSWNLDEYVGVDVLKSYASFMTDTIFSRLNPGFAKTLIPAGTEIDEGTLEHALRTSRVPALGTRDGKAFDLRETENAYLRWIHDEILQPYIAQIRQGIDWWVVGCGRNGHAAFHESGIQLDQDIMLVRLDSVTREDAVHDGYFFAEEAPKYAVTMGARGVVDNARNVLLLASGERKAESIAVSLLGPETADVPISILQRNMHREDRHTIYVVDEAAAQGIEWNEGELSKKGINIERT